MKTQLVEPTETIELVPQILDLKKILVPIDFSETSKKAFQYALRFAEQFDCEITLIHVVERISPMVGGPLAFETFPQPQDDSIAAKKELAAFAARSRSNGTNSITARIRTGHPPNEITK